MNDSISRELMEYNSCFKEIDDTYRSAARLFAMPECRFWILYALWVEGSLTQSEICGLQAQPKQTVNSALKRMEADGLIRLETGANQRSKRVSLTTAGRGLAARTVDRVAGAETRALETLADGERARLFALLKRYNSLLRAEFGRLAQEGTEE